MMRLDHSANGSIMRHTRPGDAATHDHSFVAPLSVEAGVTLTDVHCNASATALRVVHALPPYGERREPYVRSP